MVRGIFLFGLLRRFQTRVLAVILLDELEKAHKVSFLPRLSRTSANAHVVKDVSMILLQILDEGSITDSQGRKVDFKVCCPLAPLSTVRDL